MRNMTFKPLYTSDSKMHILTKCEDPESAVFHLDLLFAKTKPIFRERNTILFGNSNLCPLHIFNEPSQAYYTKSIST